MVTATVTIDVTNSNPDIEEDILHAQHRPHHELSVSLAYKSVYWGESPQSHLSYPGSDTPYDRRVFSQRGQCRLNAQLDPSSPVLYVLLGSPHHRPTRWTLRHGRSVAAALPLSADGTGNPRSVRRRACRIGGQYLGRCLHKRPLHKFLRLQGLNSFLNQTNVALFICKHTQHTQR